MMLNILCGIFFLVAMLYASVGHGGASGYLAVWSFLTLAPEMMATSALCLNLLVAGTAWHMFASAGHLSRRLTWPFMVASVPAAFLGGLMPMSPHIYGWLLAVTLVVAAIRLVLPMPLSEHDGLHQPSLKIALPTGAGIGLLSGMVGVGGGIFLSPLMLVMQWAKPKYVAATSAVFIVVNSAAGLIARAVGGQLALNGSVPLIGCAFLGGVIGARLGSRHVTGRTLRQLLAVVLLIAAIKMVLRAMA